MPRKQKNISSITAIRIRELRKKQGLTQKELADKLYKSESTVRMWELEKSEPDNETIRQLSKIFNVSPSYIIGGPTIRNIAKPAKSDKNVIVFRGRDGSKEENELSDAKFETLKKFLNYLNDSDKDN